MQNLDKTQGQAVSSLMAPMLSLAVEDRGRYRPAAATPDAARTTPDLPLSKKKRPRRGGVVLCPETDSRSKTAMEIPDFLAEMTVDGEPKMAFIAALLHDESSGIIVNRIAFFDN